MKLLKLAVLACSAAAAYGAENSWDRLRELRTGEPVSVVRQDFKRVDGTFSALADDAITLESDGRQVGIARDDVYRVTSRARSKRLRNALIGAGIGAGLGLVLDRTVGEYLRNETGLSSGTQALLWITPIAAGAGLGATQASYPTLYRAEKRKK